MAEFSGQSDARAGIIAALTPVLAKVYEWIPVWDKLTKPQKVVMVFSGASPLISAALGIYIVLRPLFAEFDEAIDTKQVTLNTEEMKLEGEVK